MESHRRPPGSRFPPPSPQGGRRGGPEDSLVPSPCPGKGAAHGHEETHLDSGPGPGHGGRRCGDHRADGHVPDLLPGAGGPPHEPGPEPGSPPGSRGPLRHGPRRRLPRGGHGGHPVPVQGSGGEPPAAGGDRGVHPGPAGGGFGGLPPEAGGRGASGSPLPPHFRRPGRAPGPGPGGGVRCRGGPGLFGDPGHGGVRTRARVRSGNSGQSGPGRDTGALHQGGDSGRGRGDPPHRPGVRPLLSGVRTFGGPPSGVGKAAPGTGRGAGGRLPCLAPSPLRPGLGRPGPTVECSGGGDLRLGCGGSRGKAAARGSPGPPRRVRGPAGSGSGRRILPGKGAPGAAQGRGGGGGPPLHGPHPGCGRNRERHHGGSGGHHRGEGCRESSPGTDGPPGGRDRKPPPGDPSRLRHRVPLCPERRRGTGGSGPDPRGPGGKEHSRGSSPGRGLHGGIPVPAGPGGGDGPVRGGVRGGVVPGDGGAPAGSGRRGGRDRSPLPERHGAPPGRGQDPGERRAPGTGPSGRRPGLLGRPGSGPELGPQPVSGAMARLCTGGDRPHAGPVGGPPPSGGPGPGGGRSRAARQGGDGGLRGGVPPPAPGRRIPLDPEPWAGHGAGRRGPCPPGPGDPPGHHGAERGGGRAAAQPFPPHHRHGQPSGGNRGQLC